MNIIDRFKKDSKFALLVMLAIGLIALILLAIFIHFSLWFWIALILWLLFAVVFYFKWIVIFKITQMLTCSVFVAVVIVSIVFMFLGKGSGAESSKGGSALVKCTSDGSDSPQSIAGWNAKIFSKAIDSSGSDDTMVRSFSISSLDAKSGTGLYYLLEKSDGSVVTGAKGLIEVCDGNNMTSKYDTTRDTTTTPASDGALAVYYYLHGNHRVKTPGTYRIDAYANVDGSWKLVARENAVTFSE